MPGPIERLAGAAQPTIVDGIRGVGIPVTSSLGVDGNHTGVRVQTFRGYSSDVSLIIDVPGQDPYTISLLRWMTYDKFAVIGTPLPVTVARDDPTKIYIEWDEVPTIDEMISAGAPVFTDPDTVQANLRLAKTRSVKSVIEKVDDAADAFAQASGADVAPGQVRSIMQAMRGEVDAGSPLEYPRVPPDQPSARVIAHTRPDMSDQGSSGTLHSQMLLSVSVPGRPRFGYRWKGMLHGRRFFEEWTDLPVEIKRNGSVHIDWSNVETVGDVAARELKRATEVIDKKIAALKLDGDADAMQQLIAAAVPDPEQRAEVQEQMAQAAAQPWANPLAAPVGSAPAAGAPVDAAALLNQLSSLHDAGALTDDEYAAERQRVLDQI